MPQNPQFVQLTLKNGKKVKFKQFGKINFGYGIKTINDLDKQEQKKIEKMYAKIVAETQKKISEIKNKTATDALNKMQLKDLEISLKNNLYELTQTTQNMIVSSMTTTSKAVVQGMTSWINSYGIKIKQSYANVPQDVVSNIVSGRLYGKDWTFSKRIWGDYNKSVSDITAIVAKGIAENKSAYEIAKDLEIYVNPKAAKPWDWSKVYPGCKRKIDYNAQRLARTMRSHAYQQSIVETCKDNPFVKGIEWLAANTHTTCEICEALNGQIFPVNQVPLDHPNGKCTFLAVIDKSSKEIANDLIKWYHDDLDGEYKNQLDKFAESAGFNKSDFDLNKMQRIINQ